MKVLINIYIKFIICILPTYIYSQPVWIAEYTGEFNPSDNQSYAIAIDEEGNVYVTGMCDSNPLLCDLTNIATIKYNSSDGGQAWINRYRFCGGSYPDANSGNSIATITIGLNTYVYVTGRVFTNVENGHFDIVTIQYNARNGNILWVQTYNGTGNGSDEALHIEVDSEGNSYVTGYFYNLNDNIYSDDYATIKYDIDGNLQWVQTYNGTANGKDVAKSLKLIGGTVYVTGTSAGNGTGEDIVTIAYDSQGNQIWLSRYNNGLSDIANDIAVGRNIPDDIPRDVYVTGSSGDNIITIRYDYSEGTVVWAKNNITGVGNSIGVYISPDYTTNIFVTGYTKISDIHYGITVKYDKEGNEQWDPNPIYPEQSDFVSLGIDGSENVYVFGSVDSPNNYYLTVKYNYNGIQQWENIYHYPNSDNGKPKDLKVNTNGYSYVTGSFYLTQLPTPSYYVTLKYAP